MSPWQAIFFGAETASRPWVTYEIKKAWNERRGLFGIYIQNLKCSRNGTCTKGNNPLSNLSVGSQSLSTMVPCYDPNSWDAYNDIKRNLQGWVASAITRAQARRD